MNTTTKHQPIAKLQPVGDSALQISPLTLGTNVFDWTIDQDEAFAVLDEYVALGGNSIDTADVYSFWGDGNIGGEAETVLGSWLKSRKLADQLVIATKAGAPGGRFGSAPDASPTTLRRRLTDSLARLQLERVDLFYLHTEDPTTAVEDIAVALCDMITEGLIGNIAVSNYSAGGFEQLHDAVTAINPLAAPIAMQPRWSMVHRAPETQLLSTARDHNIAMIPYWGLEKGFLTGKYRDPHLMPTTARQERHRPHELYDSRGQRIITAVETVAEALKTSMAAVALAWLLHQEQVASVIASARNPQQLNQLADVGTLELTDQQLQILTDAAHDDDPE